MRRIVVAAVAVLTLYALPVNAEDGEPAILVPDQGPEVPTTGYMMHRAVGLASEYHPWGVKTLRGEVDVPTTGWDRVLLVYRNWPDQEPWDRTFEVGINGTELLHGTTPRGDFTVTKDITEYAALFEGGVVELWSRVDTWTCCGFYVDLAVEFYSEVPPTVHRTPFDAVESPFKVANFGGPGSTRTVSHNFSRDGDPVPTGGVMDFITSGHSACGEFWYQLCGDAPWDPPRFQIYVDGAHAGTVHVMPYVYALLGFSGGTESHMINNLWWTAFQGADAAGIHTGVGEIRAYRAAIPDHILPLLVGDDVEVQIVKENHGGSWPTSLNFLLDY